MADQDRCTICMEEFLDGVPGEAVAGPSTHTESTTHPRNVDDQDQIALITACGHILHNLCLQTWIERANTCPSCRQQFNSVEVLDKVGGPVVFQYAVKDKKQKAIFDPDDWLGEDLDDGVAIPCPICAESDQEDVLLLCDACDAPYHTHCVGLDRVPSGQWFCMECVSDGANEIPAIATPRQTDTVPPRTLADVRHNRRRVRINDENGTYNSFRNRVYDVVGLDLDFPDEGQQMAGFRIHQRRNMEERREFRSWERHLNTAGRRDTGEIFRNSAPILREQRPKTPIESAEEVQAWGAFDKATKLDTETTPPRGRKRKSVTASPSEAGAAAASSSSSSREPERKLKRPRTRPVFDTAAASSATPLVNNITASSIHRSMSLPRPGINTSNQPSFLSSLLKEVESSNPEDGTMRSTFNTVLTGPRVTSPSIGHSSPGASPSPSSSPYLTPRAMSISPHPMSITPPPHVTKRSGSPVPLSSRVDPYTTREYTHRRFSPDKKEKPDDESLTLELRQPRPRRLSHLRLPRSEETSPTRAEMSTEAQADIQNIVKSVRTPHSEETSPARAKLSIEAKEGITKMVKSALAPHYKSAKITKEQYADINRNVSRKLYDIVADSSKPNDQNKWERIAFSEVATALKSLTA